MNVKHSLVDLNLSTEKTAFLETCCDWFPDDRILHQGVESGLRTAPCNGISDEAGGRLIDMNLTTQPRQGMRKREREIDQAHVDANEARKV